MENIFNNAAEIISNADALLIGTGAGMGVDSGLPDFRGTEGFWKAYPPIAKLGIRFEQMANPRWFDREPRLAWAFYGHRYNLYKDTVPHKGFEILLEIGKKMSGGYFVYTSNVDGHFQKAGFDNDKIYEIHGSINHLQCIDSCSKDIWEPDFDYVQVDMEKFQATGNLPACKHCDKNARPNVLMFGDWGWIGKRSNEQHDRYVEWLQSTEKANKKIVIIEIGAGTSVPSVRFNSQKIARQFGATLLRINPRESNSPAGHLGVPFGALMSLEKIIKYL